MQLLFPIEFKKIRLFDLCYQPSFSQHIFKTRYYLQLNEKNLVKRISMFVIINSKLLKNYSRKFVGKNPFKSRDFYVMKFKKELKKYSKTIQYGLT